MNCRPGDLAVVVRSDAGNDGKIVFVVRAAAYHEYAEFDHADEGRHWWVECKSGLLMDTWGGGEKESSMPDARLRPIRPGDISDEEVRDLYAPKVPELA